MFGGSHYRAAMEPLSSPHATSLLSTTRQIMGFPALGCNMTSAELLRRLRRTGCVEVRQRGSHVIVRCGRCQTTVPVHAGRDVPRGTLGAIRRDLRPCLDAEDFNAVFS